jgi:hypothetical protein
MYIKDARQTVPAKEEAYLAFAHTNRRKSRVCKRRD